MQKMQLSSVKNDTDKLIMALPKGRILEEAIPVLKRADIEPEAAFFDPKDRRLHFKTNHSDLQIIRVRSFDVATFIAFGSADIGIAGYDVLQEFKYDEIYAPVDLGIGACRLSIAAPESLLQEEDPASWTHIRVASKYPSLTQRYFAARGIQAEIIKLNGAIELAPLLNLCPRIVDLVSSGATLKANGLVEVESLLDVTSRIAVNRTALKTKSERLGEIIASFRNAAKK